MSMDYPYCNTSSDLQYVFKNIEQFSGKETITTFELVSGSVYSKHGTGYCGIVYADDVALTEKTSIATVEATASTFWYDETNDILYIHTPDGSDPDLYTIKIATEDWETLKTFFAERAFQQLENMLDPKYPRPIPFAKDQYNSKNYDSDIVESAALLTCVNIIKHTDPDSPLIKTFMDRVWNAEEEKGVMWEYAKGLRSFSFEATADQFDGNIMLVTRDANSTGLIFIAGTGDHSGHYLINIKIVTDGAVGTATWKYSVDGKTNWSSAITSTINYMYLYAGIYIRMSGTFVTDDEWLVEILGGTEEITNKGIRSIRLTKF